MQAINLFKMGVGGKIKSVAVCERSQCRGFDLRRVGNLGSDLEAFEIELIRCES